MAGPQSWPDGTARAEWRAHWPLVMASLLGFMMIGVANFSLGPLIGPLRETFGWTVSEITSGLTVYAVVSVICQPLVGRMIDLWGPRRIGLAGIALTGGAIALFATANGTLIGWLALWLVYSLAAQLVLTPVWSAAVASEFHAGRGLALATTLSGSGLCGFVIPIVSTALIDRYGWRNALPMLGLGMAALLLLVTYFLFHSRRDRVRTSDGPAEAVVVLTGLSASEALRSATFYKLGVAIVASYTLAMAISIHNVPMLTSVGMTRGQAAVITAFFGLFAVAGKFASGLLVGRVAGHIVTAGLLLLPVASCLLLLMPSPAPAACFVAVALFGMSAGGQLQMLVYLTTRHFGMLAFGAIFGFIGSAMTIASAVGPVAAGRLFDYSGDYHLLLIGGIPLSIVGALVMLSVGDYPEVREARALAGQAIS
jgi:MFS family permease